MTTINPNDPMPSALDAEKGVLASCLLDPEGVIAAARGRLRAEDFHLPAHRVLWDLLIAKTDAKEPVEPVSILQTLMDRGKVEEIGGAATLTELMGFVQVATHWEYYAEIILDKAARRRGMDQMTTLWKAFMDSGTDWRGTVSQAQSFLSEMLAGRMRMPAVPWRQVMHESVELIEARLHAGGRIIGGLATGLTDVDRMFMGLSAPSILTVAGRPSMGKSVLLQGIAERVASGFGDYDEYDQEPKPVLFISTEMNRTDLGMRSIAARSGVNIKRVTDGRANSEEMMQVTQAASDLTNINLHIAYMPGASAEQIASTIHAWDAVHRDTAAYVIDHMTDVGAECVKDKGNQVAMTTMAWQIVTDAIKHVNKVGVLGCQLSRENSGKLPVLSDLKGSTKIEEVSSHVIFIHRPWYYELRKEHPDESVDPMAAIFMIAKNRNGRCGPIGAYFDADITRFRSETSKLYSANPEDHQHKQTYHNRG